MVQHNVRYIGFVASAAALLWLAEAGIIPIPHPFRDEWMLDTSAHSPRTIDRFFRRDDVAVTMFWVVATTGATVTLPSNYNPSGSQVNAIGSGIGGGGGGGGVTCSPGGGGGAGGGGPGAGCGGGTG